MKREKVSDLHEWIEWVGNIAKVGILKSALKEIGEIVNIQFPETGKRVKKNEEILLLESSKSAIEIYSPLDGKIIEINNELKEDLSLLNRSPEDKGWLFKIQGE